MPLEPYFNLPIQAPVTTGKVPVTVARTGKIRWQAGMSRFMSDVRSYGGGYRERVYVNACDRGRESRERWETPAAPRNVPKNDEVGEICGERGERQSGFLRNSALNGVRSVALQLQYNARSSAQRRRCGLPHFFACEQPPSRPLVFRLTSALGWLEAHRSARADAVF